MNATPPLDGHIAAAPSSSGYGDANPTTASSEGGEKPHVKFVYPATAFDEPEPSTPEDKGSRVELTRQLEAKKEIEAFVRSERDCLISARGVLPRYLAKPPRIWQLCEAALRIGTGGFCMLLVALNSGRFAIEKTQSLPLALLFTGVLPAVGPVLDAVAERLSPKKRGFLDGALTGLFFVSTVTFLGAFGNDFAQSLGVNGIKTALGAFDLRVTFWAQAGLECAMSYLLLTAAKAQLAKLREPVPNPNRVEHDRLVQAKNEELICVLGGIATLEAKIAIHDEREARAADYRARVARFFQP